MNYLTIACISLYFVDLVLAFIPFRGWQLMVAIALGIMCLGRMHCEGDRRTEIHDSRHRSTGGEAGRRVAETLALAQL